MYFAVDLLTESSTEGRPGSSDERPQGPNDVVRYLWPVTRSKLDGPSEHTHLAHGVYARPVLVARSSLALLTAAALALPVNAWALAPAKLDPDQARAQRDATLEQADSLAEERGVPAAVEQIVDEAEASGDPALFLAASERLREHAETEKDEALAEQAEALARTAHDIALYLADQRRFDDTNWRPVTREEAEALAEQAEDAAAKASALAEQIVEEREAAAAAAGRAEQTDPEDEGRPERERKPGTGLLVGGAVALSLGIGGVAMIGAGVGIGSARQREAEGLALPAEQDRLDVLDRQGAQANVITYAGIGVAAVGIATGIALIVVGSKRRKQGANERASALRAGPWIGQRGAGLTIGGRF